MQLTIIKSPYAGNVLRNIRYARLCCLDSLRRGEAPFASHLFYTQMLPEQRRLGMDAGFAWGERADLHAFYTDLGISPGMEQSRKHLDGATYAMRNLPIDLIQRLGDGHTPDAVPRHRYRIVDVAEAIWGHYSGASDPMPDDEVGDCARFLEDRLAEWHPSVHWALDYDTAIRNVAIQALRRHYQQQGPKE